MNKKNDKINKRLNWYENKQTVHLNTAVHVLKIKKSQTSVYGINGFIA